MSPTKSLASLLPSIYIDHEGKDVFPLVSVIARPLSPFIPIALWTSCPRHEIGATSSTHQFRSWNRDLSPIEMGLRYGYSSKGHIFRGEELQVVSRNEDMGVSGL